MSSQQQVEALHPARPLMGRMQLRLAAWSRWDLAALALVVVLAILAAATVQHYSVSNDEEVQQRYGLLILAYYGSGFVDQTLFRFENLYLYGGLFDVAAVLLQQILPLEPYLVRHILCAAFGLGGIIAVWGTARCIGGSRAGLIAIAMIAVTGPWFGSMFNHTKDIPFAAVMMWACYYLALIGRSLPHPRPIHVLGFGILLGCALGLRSLALLLVGYAGVTVLLHLPRPILSNLALRFAMRSALTLAPALVTGYLIMLVLWPWAALAPLNPIRGLEIFGNFNYGIETILSGHVYKMADVPRWYVPAYLAIKLPIALLLGALIALAWLSWLSPRQDDGRRDRRNAMLIAFMAAFPLLCEVTVEGPAFTGMRHFLFVIPPLAALAGLGWEQALLWLQRKSRALMASLAMAIAAGPRLGCGDARRTASL